MSWKATGFVKDLSHGATGERLTVTEKFALLLIADDYVDDQHCCHPGVPKLASRLLLSERQTIRILDGLEKKRAIRVRRYRINGQPIKGKANEYSIIGFDGVTVSSDIGDMTTCHAKRKDSGDIVTPVTCHQGSNSHDIAMARRRKSFRRETSEGAARAGKRRAPPPKTSRRRSTRAASKGARSAPAESDSSTRDYDLEWERLRIETLAKRRAAAEKPAPQSDGPLKPGTELLKTIQSIQSPEDKRRAELKARVAEREAKKEEMRAQAQQILGRQALAQP